MDVNDAGDAGRGRHLFVRALPAPASRLVASPRVLSGLGLLVLVALGWSAVSAFRAEDLLVPWGLGLHVASDLAIAASYFAISATLLLFYARVRHDVPFQWIFPAFGLFIVACGGTHVMHALLALGVAATAPAALVQGITVGASVATAVVLPPLLPRVLAIVAASKAADRRRAQLIEAQRIAHLGSWEWDIPADRTSRSAELYRIVGRDPSAVDDSFAGYLACVHPDDRAGLRATMDAALRDRVELEHEHRVVRPDGEVREVLARARLVADADGRPVRALGTVQDVTDRKAVELQLRTMNEELERRVAERTETLERTNRELRHFAAVIQFSHDPIVAKDVDGTIISWNPAAERAYGYTAEEAIGRPVWMLVPPARRAEAERALGLIRRGDRVPPYNTRRVCKDGREIDVELSHAPILDPSGTIVGISTIHRDVSARLRAQRTIVRLNADLERRARELAAINEELESFSYSVSHDLRAPLRAISGFSQALAREYGERLDQTGRDYLDRVCAAAQRMSTLIDDLLRLSRVTRAEIRREPVDLSAAARSILDELARTDPERRVTARVTPGLACTGDPTLLRVLLENLLGNAWKFTRPRPEALIELGATTGEAGVTYFVRDNGVGFDEAYADKLFGAFQRLHTRDEFEGSGIGLASAQRIVHRHGGRIWAEAAEGRGATFWFTLDVAKEGRDGG
jgi:PAS domain S-box-containing protein